MNNETTKFWMNPESEITNTETFLMQFHPKKYRQTNSRRNKIRRNKSWKKQCRWKKPQEKNTEGRNSMLIRFPWSKSLKMEYQRKKKSWRRKNLRRISEKSFKGFCERQSGNYKSHNIFQEWQMLFFFQTLWVRFESFLLRSTFSLNFTLTSKS